MTGKTFDQELKEILNYYSRDSKSNTADFILAAYLIKCLEAFESAISAREGQLSKGEKFLDIEEAKP